MRIFLIPPLHHILESENFRLHLSKENSVTCVVKYENQTSENRREFIREGSKMVHEWNVHLAIFSRVLRTDILQKAVVGCPWLNNVKFPKCSHCSKQI